MNRDNYLNPFDDEHLEFTVLVNEQQQYSLWPVFAALPAGWQLRFGPSARQDCLDYVESHWLSINPFQTKA